MLYQILADMTILLHLIFILFVVFGGFLVQKRRMWVFLHIPALIWGIIVEVFNLVCPLTPLENYFYKLSGNEGYAGGFIEHYIVPLVYPAALTRELQWLFAGVVIVVNAVVYWRIIRTNLINTSK